MRHIYHLRLKLSATGPFQAFYDDDAGDDVCFIWITFFYYNLRLRNCEISIPLITEFTLIKIRASIGSL
jgi:hypothetical protein